ncbi:MAG: tyrosine-type recombinase/integrase [Ignavibacteriaceae bacterium]
MRLGELLNMKWNWIDFQQNIIKVQNSETFTTKSKKERIIPISSTLRNLFTNQFPNNSFAVAISPLLYVSSPVAKVCLLV